MTDHDGLTADELERLAVWEADHGTIDAWFAIVRDVRKRFARQRRRRRDRLRRFIAAHGLPDGDTGELLAASQNRPGDGG